MTEHGVSKVQLYMIDEGHRCIDRIGQHADGLTVRVLEARYLRALAWETIALDLILTVPDFAGQTADHLAQILEDVTERNIEAWETRQPTYG